MKVAPADYVDEVNPEGIAVGDLWRNESDRVILILRLGPFEPMVNRPPPSDNRCFATYMWLDTFEVSRILAAKLLWPIFQFTRISSLDENL